MIEQMDPQLLANDSGLGPIDMVCWFLCTLPVFFFYNPWENLANFTLLTNLMSSGFPVFEDVLVSTTCWYILYIRHQ
jgi:hypothetical protein